MSYVPDRAAMDYWAARDAKRSTLKDRWGQYAQYTLPYLYPAEGKSCDDYDLKETLDSVAAQGVNHLANKLMVTAFNTSTSFARLTIPKKTMEQIMASSGLTADAIEEMLSVTEQEMMADLMTVGIRPDVFELLKHLIVLGNVMMDTRDDLVKVIPVKHYVVSRSVRGTVLEFMTAEPVAKEELSDELVKTLPDKLLKEKALVIYSWFQLERGAYKVSTYINDYKLPEDNSYHKASYPKDDCPLHILTWVLPARSNYGIGLIEENRGDIFMIDLLSEALSDGAALASLYRWLVAPESVLDTDEFNKLPNGAAVTGREKDINLVTANNNTALQTVIAMFERYEQRLSAIFLKTTGLVRNAERVTAEEVRRLADELDTSLGGVYTRLSKDLQQPIANWLFSRTDLAKKANIDIRPVIITGMDALSRNVESEKLIRALTNLTQLATLPPDTRDWLRLDAIIKQLFAAEGIASFRYVATQAEAESAANNRAAAEAAHQAAVAGATNNAVQPVGAQPNA